MNQPTPAWASNTTTAELAGVLRGAKRVVCLTHSRPDGDAVGSSLGIARTLLHLGVEARVHYIAPEPRWLAEIAGPTRCTIHPAGAALAPALDADNPDLVVVTDTGSWSQLAEAADWLRARTAKTVVIDHHLHGDPDVGRWMLLGTRAAASTQVLAPLCAELMSRPLGSLPRDVAEALYLGLATDTQWFRLSNVTPDTLRLAACLIEAGADHTRLYEVIEQQDSPARWRLLARALSTLELHAAGRVAMMRLTLRDFTECGADRNDTSGFADMVLHIASVRMAVVLTEGDVSSPGQPTTKVSMRSKPGPDAVDVNALTRALGGGGHARAAGAKMPGVDLEEARRRVLALVS